MGWVFMDHIETGSMAVICLSRHVRYYITNRFSRRIFFFGLYNTKKKM